MRTPADLDDGAVGLSRRGRQAQVATASAAVSRQPPAASSAVTPCFLPNTAIASISTSRSSRHSRAWIPVLAGSGSRPSQVKNAVRTSLKSL